METKIKRKKWNKQKPLSTEDPRNSRVICEASTDNLKRVVANSIAEQLQGGHKAGEKNSQSFPEP